MRVLLIDDDSQLNRLAAFALRGHGLSVVSTTIPAEGVRLATAEDFDLVLLDVMMPDLDGPAVLHLLRASERTRALPVIFMSASDVAASVRELGVHGVIRKPFDPARIAGEVLSMLGRTEPAASGNDIPPEMQRSFLISAVERVAAIARALDSLQRQPEERAHLLELRAEFHRVAGAAASYGFTSLSDAASHGEMECDGVDDIPAPALLHRWRDLLQEMRSHLAAAGADIAASGNAATRLVRLLCIGADAAVETSLRLLDSDSLFEVEFAQQLPQTGPPDVLVIQAGNAGFTAVEALRSTPHGRRTSVLVITSRRLSGESAARAVSAGIDEVLTEAADAASVVGAVRALVDRKFGRPPRVLAIGLAQHASSFVSVLESAGYAVRVAASVGSAEIELGTFEPDLVVAGAGEDLDASLTFVRSVHLLGPAPAVPVVLVASNLRPDLPLLAARAGVAALLPLPISRGLLLATVQNHLARAHAHKLALQRDPLTGCLSEAYFRERLQQRLRSASRDSSLTLALLEPGGSAQPLLALSALLRRRLRETDQIARCGPTRLIVLMEGIDEETARALFTRLREENLAATGHPFHAAIVAKGQHASAARWIAAAGEALAASLQSPGSAA
jgi:DNA-binding response OmpR family regulator